MISTTETTATIIKLVKDRGFGLAENAGQLYFFHFSAIDPRTKLDFNNLMVGNRVVFQSEPGERGPRAKTRTMKLVINTEGII